MEDIYILIAEVGFPITAALGVAGGFWAILKWLMNNLAGEIGEVQTGLSETQSELMSKLNSTQQEQYTILVKLIDRIRTLEDSITRIEIVIRTAHNLEQEWGRIGKAQDKIDQER
tara:strand:+ start:374 stop:718 length:345 start_codon:yes stop_codon:yes gene_type:complete